MWSRGSSACCGCRTAAVPARCAGRHSSAARPDVLRGSVLPMPSQGGVPRSGDSEGASDRYGGQAQPQGPPGGHGQSQGYGRPQGPYAAGAPLAQPASHLVAVKPGLKDTAIQLAGQGACLLLGIVPLVLAIQRPHVRGMWIALAVGG